MQLEGEINALRQKHLAEKEEKAGRNCRAHMLWARLSDRSPRWSAMPR